MLIIVHAVDLCAGMWPLYGPCDLCTDLYTGFCVQLGKRGRGWKDLSGNLTISISAYRKSVFFQIWGEESPYRHLFGSADFRIDFDSETYKKIRDTVRKRMKRSFKKSKNVYQRMLKKFFFQIWGGKSPYTGVWPLYGPSYGLIRNLKNCWPMLSNKLSFAPFGWVTCGTCSWGF